MTFAMRYWKLPLVAVACIILHNMCETNDDDYAELEGEQEWGEYADHLAENGFPGSDPHVSADATQRRRQAAQAQGGARIRENFTTQLENLRAANDAWLQEQRSSGDDSLEDG